MSKDGGLAFKGQRYEEVELVNGDIKMEMVTHCGMSLRDWFAGMALSSTTDKEFASMPHNDVADWCYCVADAMIEERNKEA